MAGVEQLIEDMKRLREDQEMVDVCFLVGPEEDRIYAHKLILSARCKIFRPDKDSMVRLPNVNSEVFKKFISYVYTGKVTFNDCAFEMMTLAHDMDMACLKTSCEDHIISSALNVENACKYLLLAMESGSKCAASFIQRCITFVGENATECVKTKAFLNLTKEGLIKLISSDYFCLEEENVWRCVLEWAKHQAGVTQKTVHWTEEERIRVCQHLHSGVMNYVRLLLIDSKFFAEEVEPTGAVPIELSLERYRYAALNNQKNLPQSNQQLAAPQGNNENDKRLQPRLLVNMFPGSVILRADKMHLQSVLNNWFGNPKQNWKLLFRASANNFSASSFHNICDGVAPLFVIGLGQHGEISGGFTDVPWIKPNRQGAFIHSEKSFLFALNPNGTDASVKFEILKKPYAICYDPDCGPVFGAGADLSISNECNMNQDSYSNLPHSYSNPSSINLFGDYNFQLVEYEVFTATFTNGATNGQKNN